MSPNLKSNSAQLREAFYMLSVAQDVPDAKLLDDVIGRYPQFSAELTDFAISIAIESLHSSDVSEETETANDPTVVSPAVSRAMSHFQNQLYARGIEATDKVRVDTRSVGVANPFSALSRDEFRGLAKRLNANSVFVGKLRDRQIDPETITPGFRERIADELTAPLDLIVAHFEANQVVSRRQYFKADEKPSLGAQQSFQDAVRKSGLNAAQQKFLLEL